MKPYKNATLTVNGTVLNLILDEKNEQYMWGDAGLNYKIVDDKIICDCNWLHINEKNINGIEIKERFV